MSRYAASGYERLAQDAELSDSEDDLQSILSHPGRIASVLTGGGPRETPSYHERRASVRRNRSNSSGVDIKAINARLERWAEEIANKFKLGKKKGKGGREVALEIVYSVYVPPEGMRPIIDLGQVPPLGEPDEQTLTTRDQFDEIGESVRRAIAKGLDPILIKQGSSGSYFARNLDGNIVSVFKPKDEEPYGHLNPKTMKWIHRNLFPCFFGRSCLIPNLSYVSEAAACQLDRQLRTFIVPYTDIVWLASKAFHYDYWDRRAFYRKKRPLPPKVGSFQAFLEGYEDASKFFRKYPWPDQYSPTIRTDVARSKRVKWGSTCRPSAEEPDDDDGSTTTTGADDPQHPKFEWTEQVMQQFREELEKLVILDYIMRNTDRGLDNWMIKIRWVSAESSSSTTDAGASSSRIRDLATLESFDYPTYRLQEPMVANSRSSTPSPKLIPKLSIGAIDNSLAFPWKHPDQWRSFPFGWLFLPVSLIGQPFSTKARNHFLPILTSTKWWVETQSILRSLFEQDSDFKESMFRKQIAVLKGQAFNVVETLKSPDQGPLELTRRTRVHVWDDEIEVPIAVPLRVPSTETRRRREIDGEEQEEMDIGASATSAPLPHDFNLLDFDFSPPAEIPAIRFSSPSVHSASGGDGHISPVRAEEEVVASYATLTKGVDHGQPDLTAGSVSRSDRGKHKISYEDNATKSPLHGHMPQGRKRTHSFGTALFNDDDIEGDLGYAAVAGMEKQTRKVIAERLETVKANNPVFSWC